MEAIAMGLASLGLGLTRMTGIRIRARNLSSKDKAMLAIAFAVLIPCFLLIAFGRNCPECFGLIGIVIGHFFGREMGKSESTKASATDP